MTGGLRLYGEVEEVLYLAGGDVDIKIDDVAFALDVDHRARAGELRAAESSCDGLQIGVAAGAVDDGVELCLQGHGMACGIELEVGRVRGAVDDNAVKLAVEFSGGGEDAADALDGAEVGVVEGVVAGDGGVAGTLEVPRTEGADGVDVAGWNGIGECGVVRPCSIAADNMHHDMLQREVFRILARLGGVDDELRVVADDFTDNDLDFAAMLLRSAILLAIFPGRDVDVQAADVHAADVHGLDEEASDAGAKVEVPDGDERVVGAGGDDVVRGIDAQAAAGDLQAVQQRDVERVQLDLALEAGAEGFDDAAFEDGAGMMQHDLSDDDEHDQAEQEGDTQPFPQLSFCRRDSPGRQVFSCV